MIIKIDNLPKPTNIIFYIMLFTILKGGTTWLFLGTVLTIEFSLLTSEKRMMLSLKKYLSNDCL